MAKKKTKENYNPYCKDCTACGEEGCCSAMMCKHTKDGKYCEGYLLDLKFAYLMYQDTYDMIKPKKKLKEIWDKNYDLIYKSTATNTGG